MTALATSRLTGRPVASNSAVAMASAAPALVIVPPETQAPVAGLMDSMILPQVRDRWMGPAKKQYTPTYVETVLRGAASGNLLNQWQMFDLMEETWPRLSKNLNQLKDAVTDLDRQLQPWAARGQKPSAEAIRRAGVIEELLLKMRPSVASDENDWDDLVRDLLDAVSKGISLQEIDYAPVEISSGPAIGVRATRWLHPRFYGYPSSSETTDRLMLNWREIEKSQGSELPSPVAPTADGFIDFPSHKFLIGIRKTKSGHPLTGALLRVLGGWWAASNFTTEWFLNFTQIFGTPFRWANYDPAMTPADRSKLGQMLQYMGSAGYGLFPAGTVLEFKEAASNAGENAHKVLLDFADKQCDLVLLRQTLTTEVGASGSQALGTVHQSVLGDVVSGLANFTAKAINRQIIEPLCLLNFGDLKECPWLSLMETDNEDPKAKVDRIKVAVETGAEVPAQWYAEQTGIPLPQNGEAVIKRAAQVAPTMPGDPNDPSQSDEESALAKAHRHPQHHAHAKAHAATDRLLDNVLEDLTGVQASWLAGAKPFFRDLVAKAKDGSLTDEEFIAYVQAAARRLPDLAHALNPAAVATALERAMGSAVVNGAIQGHLKRGGVKV